MSSSQLLPRMKRELEILEHDPPPGIVCYPVDDNLLHFCAQVKGPKDTPYEDGLFKVDVQIPSRYPMEPPKMQFITPIYHPNVDDAGRICLDILKMPPKGSWKPSLNISTTLTSLSVLMADPNPDDPLLVEIASEYKENKSLFIQKARQSTLRHATDDKKAPNPGDLIKEFEQASSSTSASGAPALSTLSNIQQEQSVQNEMTPEEAPQKEALQEEASQKESSQKVAQDAVPKNLNKAEENNLPIFTQKKEKKKILSLSKANKKTAPPEQISNKLVSVPTASTSVKTTTSHLNTPKLLQEEEVKQVEKRRPFGDITKKSINVAPVNTINSQATTNQTQVIEKNLLNKAERKRNLLRKKPIDVPSKRQKN